MEFVTDRKKHRVHSKLVATEKQLAIWQAELESSIGAIKMCTYAFNNVSQSVDIIRKLLHDLNYGPTAPKIFRIYEETVPAILHNSMLLRYGLETILAFSTLMSNAFIKEKHNLRKLCDLWHFWTITEEEAEITQDMQEYMFKLHDLQTWVESKEDALIPNAMMELKMWFFSNKFYLLNKYASFLCNLESDFGNFSWKAWVLWPLIKVIREYDGILPTVAYKKGILLNGNLFLCGSNNFVGPTNDLQMVPLITTESRVMISKKTMPCYIMDHLLAQVGYRYIFVLNNELSSPKKCNTML
eukprot:TRINITY_DN16497_c0_g1_i1.p1 TRINITY_DN16497_c0_g1~~TRINITY_DN16497_c0_g1_i1.p1  ORF type:complete len:299 (-),score=37.60 TRINITY_DN16497_c0_g1_i1:393-1289(-)